MPKGTDIKVLLITAFILVPVIFFPASSDLSVFMLGGKIIANGGELYKDYFDLKAPFTYYFFALIDLLTSGNIVLVRIIDFIVTLSFLVSTNYILFKLNVDKVIRWIFGIAFSASYVTLSYSNTMQCETLTYLPMIWYFYQILKPSKHSTIIKGLLLGLIVSFKYSLGIVFFAEIFYYFSQSGLSWNLFKRKSLEIIIVALIVFLSFLPTILSGNTDYLEGLFVYMDKYKAHPSLSFSFIKDYIKGLGYIFGDLYSLFFSAAAIYSVAFISFKDDQNKKKLFNYLILFFLLLFLSFLIERKTNLYQFSRVYPFLILLSSYGLYNIYKSIDFKNKIVLVFIMFFTVFFSPFPRLINSMKIPVDYLVDNEKFIFSFSHNEGTGNYYSMYKLKEYTKSMGDNFIYVNSGSHQFLQMVNNYYKYPLSAFYLGDYESDKVVNEVANDMTKVDYLIIQNDDSHYANFFNHLSSYDNMIRIERFRNLLEKEFVQDTIIDGRYLIFKHKRTEN